MISQGFDTDDFYNSNFDKIINLADTLVAFFTALLPNADADSIKRLVQKAWVNDFDRNDELKKAIMAGLFEYARFLSNVDMITARLPPTFATADGEAIFNALSCSTHKIDMPDFPGESFPHPPHASFVVDVTVDHLSLRDMKDVMLEYGYMSGAAMNVFANLLHREMSLAQHELAGQVRVIEASFAKSFLLLHKGALNGLITERVQKNLMLSVENTEIENGTVKALCWPVNIDNMHWALLILRLQLDVDVAVGVGGAGGGGEESARIASGTLQYVDTWGSKDEVRSRLNLSPTSPLVAGVVTVMRKYFKVEVNPVVKYVWTGLNQREHQCGHVVNEMVRRISLGVALTAPLSEHMRMIQCAQLLKVKSIL